MPETHGLYPLPFEPIFQNRIWGGRRLGDWMGTTLPVQGPVGEAWILSDRDDMPSRVAEGALKGKTIAELVEMSPADMLGALAGKSRRFPLLIKFLDVAGMLSVQVHPPDNRTDLIPKGENGKTEAWYVLEADPGSRIYAGLKPATTAKDLRELSQNTVESHLASFAPMREQSVLVEAGTVHAIGDGLLVLEVQENSDVTFRLYDWDHIDPATGRGRPLQVEAALACIDLDQGAVLPTAAPADDRAPGPETVVDCSHFRMSRIQGDKPFAVGAADAPRVLVCVDGAGALSYSTGETHLERGGLLLLPAALGVCQFKPAGAATLLEIAAAEPT